MFPNVLVDTACGIALRAGSRSRLCCGRRFVRCSASSACTSGRAARCGRLLPRCRSALRRRAHPNIAAARPLRYAPGAAVVVGVVASKSGPRTGYKSARAGYQLHARGSPGFDPGTSRRAGARHRRPNGRPPKVRVAVRQCAAISGDCVRTPLIASLAIPALSFRAVTRSSVRGAAFPRFAAGHSPLDSGERLFPPRSPWAEESKRERRPNCCTRRRGGAGSETAERALRELGPWSRFPPYGTRTCVTAVYVTATRLPAVCPLDDRATAANADGVSGPHFSRHVWGTAAK